MGFLSIFMPVNAIGLSEIRPNDVGVGEVDSDEHI